MFAGWMGGWNAHATWLGWAGARVVSIGHMRPGLTTLSVALGIVASLEAGWILRLKRGNRVNEAQLLPRLDTLAAAMRLLTDTTEAGFTAVAAEVQRVQPPAAAPKRAKAAIRKRVTKALAAGEPAPEIAVREAVSEDEVRLHLALAEFAAATEPGADAAAGA